MKGVKPYVRHEDMQREWFQRDPRRADGYLDVAFEVALKENDPQVVLSALAALARAFGMTRVAREAGLQRESLHRMLSLKGNPEWRSLFRVFKALGVRPRFRTTSLAAKRRARGHRRKGFARRSRP